MRSSGVSAMVYTCPARPTVKSVGVGADDSQHTAQGLRRGTGGREIPVQARNLPNRRTAYGPSPLVKSRRSVS